MLHHQQSVPIPSNQLRDANRLGQVPMRMPQQQQQQRQPILMEIQPQGSGPGLAKMVAVLILIMSIGAVNCNHFSSYFTADDLEMLFGPNGCIEGVLTLMPTPSVNPVLAAAPLTLQQPKPTSVLMGPAEGDVQQRTVIPQIQQQQQQQQSPQAQSQSITNMNTSTTTTSTTTSPTSSTNVANTKEKTPMCLVNELARFNKVSLWRSLFVSVPHMFIEMKVIMFFLEF